MIFFTWDCVVEKKRAATCPHHLLMSFDEQNNVRREATTSVGEDTGRLISVSKLNGEKQVFTMGAQTTGNDLYKSIKANFGVERFCVCDTTSSVLKNDTPAADLAHEYTLLI